ncbi:T9SS type A sorting domain-containing protein [Tunicatimonas pelagia]|uniref:T9SS type A sorting domain-containing protein n=1 Tax=Tunicatimonas pelagia TaxID=931531 RepID=UPI002667003D|nr:T9SS type A sorting domain-containing protein [Tunicatimonas pelagia]WKN45991.1 T9SS type A sorting domain-containing protein [Tunicatimonas pelagia]
MTQLLYPDKSILLTVVLLLGISVASWSQEIAEWDFTTPVSRGKDELTMPWVGGLNAVQYNNIRLNGDNQNDLLLFDRSSGTLHPFLRQNGQWVYAPEYVPLFPAGLQSWVLLKDYDQDGDQDLFTASGGRGISVYQNNRDGGDGLGWTLVTETLRTVAFASGATVTLQVNSTDVPAIVDVDGDGDLDVINYSVIGSGTLILHQNQSVEQFGRADSLVYQTTNIRWGDVEECNCGIFAFNGQTCDDLNSGSRSGDSRNVDSRNGDSWNDESRQLTEAKLAHVGGKALLVLDADGDQDLDALSGDEGCYGIAFLENQSANNQPLFGQLNTNYPENTQPASSVFFPGAYLADTDADGINDLLLSPNASTNVGNSIDFENSSWQYRNDGTAQNPNWQWQTSGFLQEEMIDVGENAAPALADYDADGDLDLFIGNRGNLQENGFYAGLYLYENVGSPAQPSFQFVTSDFLSLANWQLQEVKPYFTDINQDGRTDLLISGRESESRETRLYALLNQASSGDAWEFQPEQRQLLTLPFRSEDNLAFYDVDQDQRVDVLVGKQSGNLIYYRDTGTDFPPQWTRENDAFAGIDRSARGLFLAPAIINTDGTVGILSANSSGNLLLRPLEENTESIDTVVVRNAILSETVAVQLDRQSWLAVGQILGGSTTVVIGRQRGGVSLLNLNREGASGEEITLRIFPNPATDSDVTTVQANRAVKQVQVISVAGQVVYERSLPQPLSRLNVDTRVLPPGLYVMRAFFEQGGVASAKLLVGN